MLTTQNLRNWSPPKKSKKGSFASGKNPIRNGVEHRHNNIRLNIGVPKPYPTMLPAWVMRLCHAFPELSCSGGVISKRRLRRDACKALSAKSRI